MITNQAHSQTQVTTFGFIRKKTFHKQWHVLFMAAEPNSASEFFALVQIPDKRDLLTFCLLSHDTKKYFAFPKLNFKNYLSFSHSIKVK